MSCSTEKQKDEKRQQEEPDGPARNRVKRQDFSKPTKPDTDGVRAMKYRGSKTEQKK